jgi:RecB family endonuclease NucS
MSPISTDKRAEVLALLREGEDNAAVAAKTGVPVGSVAAIKAHDKMGHYDGAASTQQSDEAQGSMETVFGLEKDLQGALRSNIAQLEEDLTITDGGKEKIVPSGRIDILATDRNGRQVVIELKAGTADRDAIGQIMSYMGDLQAENDLPRGIVIAGDFTARAMAAGKAAPNIELQKYAFKFSFHKVK